MNPIPELLPSPVAAVVSAADRTLVWTVVPAFRGRLGEASLPRLRTDFLGEVRKRTLRSAFSSIEMLGVLTILAVLIAIVLSIVPLTQHTAEKQKAATEANALVQAVMHYRQVYGKWPCEEANLNGNPFVAGVTPIDELFTADAFVSGAGTAVCNPDIDQAQIVRALLPDSSENPRRLLFLTLASQARGTNGYWVDPWNHPYRIVMGAERIVFHFGSDLVFSNLPVFVISLGPPIAKPTASASNWIFSAGVRP